METVGKKIKFYREQKGMSLRELGKLANVSHSFISDIEHERSTPSLATLEAIANALNIPTSLLISDNEKTEPSPEQKVRSAISDDPELLQFWDELTQRDDQKVLMRQVRDLPPDGIKRIIRYIKIVEDEEAAEEI